MGKASARRPVQGTASEDMHVDMEDGLAGLCPIVEDQAEIVKAVLGRDGGGGAHHLADESFVGDGYRGRTFDMPFGDDQEMDRGLGGNIPEGEDLIVFVKYFCWDLPGSNLAKETVTTHIIPH